MFLITTSDGLSHLLKDLDSVDKYTSSENTRKALNDAIAAGNWIETEPELTIVPQHDWDGMNLAILSDEDFNQVYSQCLATHPLLAASLPAALTQVANGQDSMFIEIFNKICIVGGATSEMRSRWADLAESYFLPDQIINSIR